MTILKRATWLAAWGLWIWLGFGLAHHLPRPLPPPVAQIPFGKRDQLLGFIGRSDHLVVRSGNDKSFGTSVTIYDARSGGVIWRTRGPLVEEFLHDPQVVRRHGVLFARRRPKGEGVASERGLFLLDLAKHEWRRLNDSNAHSIAAAQTRPWIATVETEQYSGQRVVILDFRTGNVVFNQQYSVFDALDAATFVLNDGRLVVPRSSAFLTSDPRRTRNFDVWRIADPPVLEKTVPGVKYYWSPSVSATGTIATTDQLGSLDVISLAEERVLMSVPPVDRKKFAGTPGFARPVISSNGRWVLGGAPASLWDIDSQKPAWQADWTQRALHANSDDRFLVHEQWSKWWQRWSANVTYETMAFRSLEGGGLIWRIDEVSDRLPLYLNDDETFAVSPNGAVYRLPLPINWRLLLICLAILAAPIVLSWGALHWRKKRRRLSLATPTQL